MSWIAAGAAAVGAILGGTGAVGNKGGFGDALKGAVIGGSLGKAGAAGFGGGGGAAGGGLGGLGGGSPFGSLGSLGTSLLGKIGGGGGVGGGLSGSLLGGGAKGAPTQVMPQRPSYFYGDQQQNITDSLTRALLSAQSPQQRDWV